MAGKCVGEIIYSPEHRHVIVLDRGGLWKVNEDVIAIFSVAEAYFLSSTKKLQNKIVSKEIVSALIENYTVLESYLLSDKNRFILRISKFIKFWNIF